VLERRIGEEGGATLVIVLILISVFGLIISGLLTEGGVSVKFTSTVSAHEASVYAADAGVSIGIQQVRQRNELCPDVSSTPQTIPLDPDTAKINGQSVTVTCQGTSGSALGARGYALIVTSTAAGALSTQSGKAKSIQGPVYVNGGLDLKKDVNIERGFFYQQAGAHSCALNDPAPSGVNIVNGTTTGYAYACRSTPAPDVPPGSPGSAPDKLGAWPVDGHRPPESKTSGSPASTCTVWYPGLYESPPVLASGNNYFASGVYYFDFDGQFTVNEKLWAGERATGPGGAYIEQPAFAPPTCAVDPAGVPDSGISGKGAEFAFGKSARFFVGKTGQAEIFGRDDPDPAREDGNSFVAVPSAWGWPDQSAAGTTVLNSHKGNGPDMAIHGLVYASNQRVELYATSSDHSQILGGVIANTLDIQSSSSVCSDCLQLSVVAGNPAPRRIVIKAVASGTSGERPVESSAVVLIYNDFLKPPTIESWRTRGVSDSL
jgi:Tfp pilus assembly protein PilX